jgi:hypothetical protein
MSYGILSQRQKEVVRRHVQGRKVVNLGSGDMSPHVDPEAHGRRHMTISHTKQKGTTTR